jgi:hypothetical protein
MMHNGVGFIERLYSQVLVLVEEPASEYFYCSGKDISPPHSVQTSSGTNQASNSVDTMGSFHRVKWLGHADHIPLSSTEDKNEWSSTQMC